jgi:hypothetical protein
MSYKEGDENPPEGVAIPNDLFRSKLTGKLTKFVLVSENPGDPMATKKALGKRLRVGHLGAEVSNASRYNGRAVKRGA